MPSEKTVETNLRNKVKDLGGLCIKLAPFWFKGLPDRMILMPKRRIYFVETKAKGKKPSPVQRAVHKKLRKLGFPIFIIDSNLEVNDFINYITIFQ